MGEVDYAALADQARQSAPVDYAALADQARQTTQPSTNTGLTMAGAGQAAPLAAKAATAFVENPNVPKIAAKVGRIVGGVAPVVTGAVEGGTVGALVGISTASKGAWAGGKTGWFTGKLLQKVTAPMASVLTKAAPYAQALTTVGGVQSGLDLMQILEPNRKDIGTFGIGKTEHIAGEHPALINLAVTKVREAFDALVGHGLTKDEAAHLLVGSPKGAK